MSFGLQEEISPEGQRVASAAVDSSNAPTAPAPASQEEQPPETPAKTRPRMSSADPEALDKVSPVKTSICPKRVQGSRPAAFGNLEEKKPHLLLPVNSTRADSKQADSKRKEDELEIDSEDHGCWMHLRSLF